MSSMTHARSTSTGLPRRVTAIVVAVALLYVGALPFGQPLLHGVCVLATVAAAAVALADQDQWRRACLVLHRGRGRHRAARLAPSSRDRGPRLPLPRPRTATTAETAAQGGTR